MKTLLLILGLVVLVGVFVYFLLKRKKPQLLATTTIEPNQPTTKQPLEKVYYTLYKCEPNGIDYYTGPLNIGTFDTGDKVEGATNTFYIITTSTKNVPIGTHIDVSGTNLKGC